LIGGRVKGFENYKISGQVKYGQRIRPSDFPVTDELFAAFQDFEANNQNISGEMLQTEKAFIKVRLRYNLATAAFGNVAANQVLIEDDPQVAKAVEALPRAGQLVLAASKTQNNK